MNVQPNQLPNMQAAYELSKGGRLYIEGDYLKYTKNPLGSDKLGAAKLYIKWVGARFRNLFFEKKVDLPIWNKSIVDLKLIELFAKDRISSVAKQKGVLPPNPSTPEDEKQTGDDLIHRISSVRTASFSDVKVAEWKEMAKNIKKDHDAELKPYAEITKRLFEAISSLNEASFTPPPSPSPVKSLTPPTPPKEPTPPVSKEPTPKKPVSVLPSPKAVAPIPPMTPLISPKNEPTPAPSPVVRQGPIAPTEPKKGEEVSGSRVGRWLGISTLVSGAAAGALRYFGYVRGGGEPLPPPKGGVGNQSTPANTSAESVDRPASPKVLPVVEESEEADFAGSSRDEEARVDYPIGLYPKGVSLDRPPLEGHTVMKLSGSPYMNPHAAAGVYPQGAAPAKIPQSPSDILPNVKLPPAAGMHSHAAAGVYPQGAVPAAPSLDISGKAPSGADAQQLVKGDSILAQVRVDHPIALYPEGASIEPPHEPLRIVDLGPIQLDLNAGAAGTFSPAVRENYERLPEGGVPLEPGSFLGFPGVKEITKAFNLPLSTTIMNIAHTVTEATAIGTVLSGVHQVVWNYALPMISQANQIPLIGSSPEGDGSEGSCPTLLPVSLAVATVGMAVGLLSTGAYLLSRPSKAAKLEGAKDEEVVADARGAEVPVLSPEAEQKRAARKQKRQEALAAEEEKLAAAEAAKQERREAAQAARLARQAASAKPSAAEAQAEAAASVEGPRAPDPIAEMRTAVGVLKDKFNEIRRQLNNDDQLVKDLEKYDHKQLELPTDKTREEKITKLRNLHREKRATVAGLEAAVAKLEKGLGKEVLSQDEVEQIGTDIGGVKATLAEQFPPEFLQSKDAVLQQQVDFLRRGGSVKKAVPKGAAAVAEMPNSAMTEVLRNAMMSGLQATINDHFRRNPVTSDALQANRQVLVSSLPIVISHFKWEKEARRFVELVTKFFKDDELCLGRINVTNWTMLADALPGKTGTKPQITQAILSEVSTAKAQVGRTVIEIGKKLTNESVNKDEGDSFAKLLRTESDGLLEERADSVATRLFQQAERPRKDLLTSDLNEAISRFFAGRSIITATESVNPIRECIQAELNRALSLFSLSSKAELFLAYVEKLFEEDGACLAMINKVVLKLGPVNTWQDICHGILLSIDLKRQEILLRYHDEILAFLENEQIFSTDEINSLNRLLIAERKVVYEASAEVVAKKLFAEVESTRAQATAEAAQTEREAIQSDMTAAVTAFFEGRPKASGDLRGIEDNIRNKLQEIVSQFPNNEDARHWVDAVKDLFRSDKECLGQISTTDWQALEETLTPRSGPSLDLIQQAINDVVKSSVDEVKDKHSVIFRPFEARNDPFGTNVKRLGELLLGERQAAYEVIVGQVAQNLFLEAEAGARRVAEERTAAATPAPAAPQAAEAAQSDRAAEAARTRLHLEQMEQRKQEFTRAIDDFLRNRPELPTNQSRVRQDLRNKLLDVRSQVPGNSVEAFDNRVANLFAQDAECLGFILSNKAGPLSDAQALVASQPRGNWDREQVAREIKSHLLANARKFPKWDEMVLVQSGLCTRLGEGAESQAPALSRLLDSERELTFEIKAEAMARDLLTEAMRRSAQAPPVIGMGSSAASSETAAKDTGPIKKPGSGAERSAVDRLKERGGTMPDPKDLPNTGLFGSIYDERE